MILSMTGFGTAASQQGGTAVAVEVRTVNHRFLDMHVRLGREYASLETDIQQTVRSLIGRGRVDVNVSIRSTAPAELLIDSEIVRAYLAAAGKLREEFHFTDSLELKTLLTLPGVLQD